MVGVIVDGPGGVSAHFYVPSLPYALLRVRDNLPLNANSVYVGEYDANLLNTLPFEAQFLVDVPTSNLSNLQQFFDKLSAINTTIVVIVPAVASMRHWAGIRDLKSQFPIMLRLKESLPAQYTDRYRSLTYDGLVVEEGATIEVVEKLAQKSSRPAVLGHNVSDAFLKSLKNIPPGDFPPYCDTWIDPLQPLTTALDMDVYETFEQDHTKYDQYDAAIEMAIDDLRLRNHNLAILVIGPGRGPLLKSVMKHSDTNDTIVAVERNEKCLYLLRQLAAPNVTIIHGDVRNLKDTYKYDLVVSELLGSFGCNEACPEILRRFLRPLLVMIPLRYSSYVRPVYSSLVPDIVRPYLASLTSQYYLGKAIKVFSFGHPRLNRMNQSVSFAIDCHRLEYANALCGYFRAHLYGPFHIGILPRMSRRCSSWYPMVFPLGRASKGTRIKIRRCSNKTKLWYEWTVGEQCFNKGGADYAVKLV